MLRMRSKYINSTSGRKCLTESDSETSISYVTSNAVLLFA